MNISIKDELILRQKKIQSFLKEENVEGALFLQDIDLLYFTNSLQVFAAYIPVEGELSVFYRKAKEKISKECPFELIEVQNYNDICNILKEKKLYPKKIGLEFDVLPVKIFNKLESIFDNIIFFDISEALKKVRMVKSSYELSLLRKAAEITKEVYTKVVNIIKPGISELDLAREIEYLYRRLNHLGPTRMRSFNHELFFGHVLSGHTSIISSSYDSPLGGDGINSAYSIGASQKIINKNETIVLDYVSNFNGYHIDTTRTFVIGELPENLYKNYENLKKVYNKICSILKPGILCSEIYNQIINYVNSLGVEENFMGIGNKKVKFIGHGIGLEIDEYPVIAPKFDIKLEKNMVVAFEPKMFFPPEGAIGLEDTFLITENGYEVLGDLSIEPFYVKY